MRAADRSQGGGQARWAGVAASVRALPCAQRSLAERARLYRDAATRRFGLVSLVEARLGPASEVVRSGPVLADTADSATGSVRSARTTKGSPWRRMARTAQVLQCSLWRGVGLKRGGKILSCF